MERVLYQATTRDAYEHSHLGWSLTYRRHRTVCEAISKKAHGSCRTSGKELPRQKPLNAYIKAISISAFNDRYDIDGKTLKSTPPLTIPITPTVTTLSVER